MKLSAEFKAQLCRLTIPDPDRGFKGLRYAPWMKDNNEFLARLHKLLSKELKTRRALTQFVSYLIDQAVIQGWTDIPDEPRFVALIDSFRHNGVTRDEHRHPGTCRPISIAEVRQIWLKASDAEKLTWWSEFLGGLPPLDVFMRDHFKTRPDIWKDPFQTPLLKEWLKDLYLQVIRNKVRKESVP